jgi:hypothetical protein
MSGIGLGGSCLGLCSVDDITPRPEYENSEVHYDAFCGGH